MRSTFSNQKLTLLGLFLSPLLALTVPLAPLRYPANLPNPMSQMPLYPVGNTSSPFCLLGSTPVCGTDTQTYPNLCVLLLLGHQKKSDGWCPEPVVSVTTTTISYKTPNNGYLSASQNSDPNTPCPCNSVYNPVCGMNGVAYTSRCRLECANVAFSHVGPCGYFNWAESPHFNCPCPYSFDPVCGNDNTTYENECALRCAHQSELHKGACRNPCNCTNIYKPVCAQNGKTYRSRCLMQCDGQTLYKSGICPKRRPKECAYCEGLRNPVCATNGVTYDNHCYLKCSGNTFYGEGVCPGDDSYTDPETKANVPSCSSCRTVNLPVCGGNNKTYMNACMARCNAQSILYRGKCLGETTSSIKKECRCSNELQPVCGRDGRTYHNKCHAGCLSIQVYYASACQVVNPKYCSHLCGNAPNQMVCGMDHKTYRNQCVMTKCMRVPLMKHGSCEMLHSLNYPKSFEYKIAPTPLVNPKPVQHHQPRHPIQIAPKPSPVPSRPVYPQSSPSVNIQNINLNDKNSVITVYKLLFPGGRAIKPEMVHYKKPLEALLIRRFRVNPNQVF